MRKIKLLTVLVIIALLGVFIFGQVFARDDSNLFSGNAKTLYSNRGKTLNDGVAAVTGSCTLYSLTVGGGDIAAGGYLLVYDAASATGTPKFDIAVGTAKNTIPVYLPSDGVGFTTGIFLDSSSDTVFATIAYE